MSNIPGSIERQSDNWISWNSLNMNLYTKYLTFCTLISGILSYPFYVITTRKQAGYNITGDKTIDGKQLTTYLIIQKIGLKGLFRGVLFSNLFYIPSSTLYLSITEISRQNANKYLHTTYPNLNLQYSDALQVLYSGILANFISLIFSNPANVVLAKMIVQEPHIRLNPIKITKNIYSTYGYSGFFLGFGSNFTHSVLGSVVWWWSYTTARRFTTISIINDKLPFQDIFWIDAISGLSAGFMSTILLHPFNTVASRIMTGATKHHSMIKVFHNIIKKEGISSLYSGILPSLSGTVSSSCIFALTYELIKRTSSKIHKIE